MNRHNVILPHAVIWRDLKTHSDHRGDLTELFRVEWQTGPAPAQWNFVRTQKNVLRGVHVHPRHDDYLVVLQNRMVLGLKDLRRDSPTHNLTSTVELEGERLSAAHIPHGVAHGFYFPSDALYLRPWDWIGRRSLPSCLTRTAKLALLARCGAISKPVCEARHRTNKRKRQELLAGAQIHGSRETLEFASQLRHL